MSEILIKTEYILLGQFLKVAGLIVNGGEAKYFFAQNVVKINGIQENRRGKKVYPGDKIQVNNFIYTVTK